MIGESERQRAEVAQILASLSTGQAYWRPSEQKWSVLGHVAHMCLVNESYTQEIDACIAKARERGRLSKGPYKHGWFGRWFTRSMEPPPKRRWVTGKAMVPDPGLDGSEVGSRFEYVQGELDRLMGDARGVDLGRARFSSPFVRVLRLSLGTGFSVLLAHNRRHIWLIREVMAGDLFPVAEEGA